MGNNKGELFREERLQLILKSLLARKKVLVTDLVREFEVSASTIRLDLAELETRGLLSRTHGGAILPEKIDNELITSKNILALREETQTEEKDAIAQAVLDLIHDGDSIMIDGGSTTARVAQRLGQRRKLTIITTSYHLLPILLEISDATIYVTGGLVHTDITVIGIDGVSVKQGLTTPDIMMAQVKKKMIALSKKLVVVADQSKMGKVCLVPVAPLDSSFTIITDGQVDIDFIEQIRSLGTKVIVAPAD